MEQIGKAKGRVVKEKPRLLWIGDAVAHTGFANVTHNVLDYLSKTWDVSVLGINYHGDPHNYKYNIYPASLGGDLYGLGRLAQLVPMIKPDIICAINDPWITVKYEKELHQNKETFGYKTVYYIPVDSPNIKKEIVRDLNTANGVIFYTNFGKNEFLKSDYEGSSFIIPHGVNRNHFYPVSKRKARDVLNLSNDWFIFGSVNRNQPRKRLDLTIEYFAEFAKDKPETVRLYIHCALKDMGYDLIDLARYYGVDERLIITDPNLTSQRGVSFEVLNYIFNSFDVQISTTQGEGWGLTQAEGMMVGVPQIAPEWSALAEWGRFEDGTDAIIYVPVTSHAATINSVNTIGGIADKHKYVDALNNVYYDEQYRKEMGELGHKRINNSEFDWKNVANQFDEVFKAL